MTRSVSPAASAVDPVPIPWKLNTSIRFDSASCIESTKKLTHAVVTTCAPASPYSMRSPFSRIFARLRNPMSVGARPRFAQNTSRTPRCRWRRFLVRHSLTTGGSPRRGNPSRTISLTVARRGPGEPNGCCIRAPSGRMISSPRSPCARASPVPIMYSLLCS